MSVTVCVWNQHADKIYNKKYVYSGYLLLHTLWIRYFISELATYGIMLAQTVLIRPTKNQTGLLMSLFVCIKRKKIYCCADMPDTLTLYLDKLCKLMRNITHDSACWFNTFVRYKTCQHFGVCHPVCSNRNDGLKYKVWNLAWSRLQLDLEKD